MGMRIIAISAIFASAILGISGHAFAQGGPHCEDRAKLLARAAEQFGETPVSVGLANQGVMVEVLASEGGATWTIITSSAGGHACVILSGEGWHLMPLELFGAEL